jgi:Tfp pilus assembly protein PilN
MTTVNLLPPEIQERTKVRRLTAALVMAGASVVVLLGLVFVLQSTRLSQVQDDLATQNQQNAALQADIDELAQYQTLQDQVAAREVLATAALQDQVLWSGVLHDISAVIPQHAWLTSLTGSVSAAAAVPPVAAPAAPAEQTAPAEGSTEEAAAEPVAPAPVDPASTLVGAIQFQGATFTQPTVAVWLTRLELVDGWVNAWVTDSSQQQIETQDAVVFTGSVDLTLDATTDRIPK